MTEIKGQLRVLETLGKPVVAAMNGTALGGGLEIALACHHRVAINDKSAQFGLPEVTLGLLPGGGGVTRIVRMLGIQDGLMKVLMQGQRMKADKAQKTGLIDELVEDRDAMMAKAREWIKANPKAQQPWDQKGYKIPGGDPKNPKFAANLPAFPANLKKQLKGANYPAPLAIMSAAIEGAAVDFDNASLIEGRYFVSLVTSQVAKNMITAFSSTCRLSTVVPAVPMALKISRRESGCAGCRHDGRWRGLCNSPFRIAGGAEGYFCRERR